MRNRSHQAPAPNRSSKDNPLLCVEDLKGAHFGPVSLALGAGGCVVVSGPSGAGKTLFLRALADLDPNEGKVWLEGKARESVEASTWRRQVGFLPAESRWWAETVGAHFPDSDKKDLAALGFEPETMTWEISRLSSGERQRLALTRLLCNRPRVLLLDEPTANLDETNRQRVERLVRDYLETHAAGALWVSHDAVQAQRVANRRLRMVSGRLVSDCG